MPNWSEPPPGAGAKRWEWARWYVRAGVAVVHLPAKKKGPNHPKWNEPGGYFTDPEAAAAHWREFPFQNLGAVLGPSGLVSFDVDHLDSARLALAAVGIDLDQLLTQGIGVQGGAGKAKCLFRHPDGDLLPMRKTSWPSQENPLLPCMVFELRSGPVQDVLPPSDHPTANRPYAFVEGREPWAFGEAPPLPAELLDLWTRWDELLPVLDAACPWRVKPTTSKSPTRRSGSSNDSWDAVREELLLRLDLEAVLEKAGVVKRGTRSYCCPFHAEESPSFWLFDTGRGYCRWIDAHGSAPVGIVSANSWSCGDALDLLAWLEKATAAQITVKYARQLGIALPGAPYPGDLPGAEHRFTDADAPPDGGEPLYVSSIVGPVAAAGGSPAEPVTPEPIRLFDRVEPFPVEVLPRPLREFTQAVAEALPCPVDFVAVPALVAMGVAVGNSRVLVVKPGWREGARLYAGIVADPGSKKSPALEHVTGPFRDRQERLHSEHQQRKTEYARELAEYEQKVARWREEVKKQARGQAGFADEPPLKPEEPTMAQVFTTDATIEALTDRLAQNPRGLLFLRDELAAWVRAMDAYRSGKGADRQYWLSFWSGASIVINRKGAKEPLCLRNPFVGVTGCLPPDLLGDLADERGRDDGFIHRILFAYPDPVPVRWTDGCVEGEVSRGYRDLIHGLWALQPSTDESGQENPVPIGFTPEARRRFAEWVNDHHAEVSAAGFHPNLKGPWAKLEGYAARLALILQLARYAAGEAETEQVEEVSVLGAAVLIDYFKSHGRRAYCRLHASDDDKRIAAAIPWIQRKGGVVSARDLVIAGVGNVKTTSEAKSLCRALAERGYGLLQPGQKGGSVFVLTTPPNNPTDPRSRAYES